MTVEGTSVTSALAALIRAQVRQSGGWMPFDRFMALALYAPRLGYYANAGVKFGTMPEGGSDFVTAPEMSPLFGQALAAQVRQALERTGTAEVWEFGAGTGALAAALLDALPGEVRYRIVEVSGALEARQRERLAAFLPRVEWRHELPAKFAGVVVGNEVLDAMPVKLIVRDGEWRERGVTEGAGGDFRWDDRPTDLRPPVEPPPHLHYLTELHPQAEAFVRTLADRLERGAAFFIDYGFGEREYYHPQRHMGTLVCHRAHRVDTDPLADVGHKDITSHVNFTGIALAAQDAGLGTLGYTSQGRFLLNCGIAPLLAEAGTQARIAGQRLVNEHEMGELFKVIGFHAGEPWDALGFRAGDRTHTL